MPGFFAALIVLAVCQGTVPLPQSSDQSRPAPPPSPRGAFDDQLSIGRLRKQLEPARPLVDFRPNPDVPLFRVEIQASRFHLFDWQTNLISPPLPVPQPFGGSDYYEMMRLITPPQFWGSAPLSNREVLSLATMAAQTWAAKLAAKKALEMGRQARATALHNEVRQELAELEAHNARVVARATANSADAKAPKKKQDVKKQQDAKKKQDKREQQATDGQ